MDEIVQQFALNPSPTCFCTVILVKYGVDIDELDNLSDRSIFSPWSSRILCIQHRCEDLIRSH